MLLFYGIQKKTNRVQDREREKEQDSTFPTFCIKCEKWKKIERERVCVCVVRRLLIVRDKKKERERVREK